MGQKASRIFSGISRTAQGVLTTVGHALSGAEMGGMAGGIPGAIIGGLGGGITSGLANIDPIISSFKGSNGSVPANINDVGNILNQSKDVFSRAGNLANNPALRIAGTDAAAGKISRGLLQMGSIADAGAKGLTSVLYKGGLNPQAVEKMASPLMNLATTQLSRRQQRELDQGRTNAMLLNTISPINPSNNPV